jgi:hypothetical protein
MGDVLTRLHELRVDTAAAFCIGGTGLWVEPVLLILSLPRPHLLCRTTPLVTLTRRGVGTSRTAWPSTTAVVVAMVTSLKSVATMFTVGVLASNTGKAQTVLCVVIGR